MMEIAISRVPKNPDWQGLEKILSKPVKDMGALETTHFHSWLSTVQKEEAQVLKQGRLLREETENKKKRAKAPAHDP